MFIRSGAGTILPDLGHSRFGHGTFCPIQGQTPLFLKKAGQAQKTQCFGGFFDARTRSPLLASGLLFRPSMDHLRAIGEWIARRRYLSSFIAILLVGGIITAFKINNAFSGRLSDPLQRGRVVDAVYGIGTVTANRRLSFNPLVGNTLRHNYVREGDKVKKGQPILVTDDGNVLFAPFDGVANYFPYRPGENAYATTPMMVFTDMSDRYIVVSMEQQGAIRVKPGQTARLSFDSLRQQTYEGKVAAVYSYASNFLARIDSVNLPDSVLPDMTCDVAVVIDVHENALLIPVVAFDKGRVWVKRGRGLPHPVPVKLGVIDGTSAEVLEGDLQAGDRVMIRDRIGQ